MSRVTNVILATEEFKETDAEAAAQLTEINRFFVEREEMGFVSVEDQALPHHWYGGGKYLETDLYIGAFNFLNLDKLVQHLRTVAWENPESVQLIVKEQEETKFRVIELFEE